jgi:hypothetical protein
MRSSASPAPRERRRGGGSILLGQHHGEDTRRHGLVGRIGRAVFERAIVAVDLPENGFAGVLETAEVMLAVWITLRREGAVGEHPRHDRGLLRIAERRDARGDVDVTLAREVTQRVVERADLVCRVHKREVK